MNILSLLTNGYFIRLRGELATAIGLNEAIVLQRLYDRIVHMESDPERYKDNRWSGAFWWGRSCEDWQKQDFPWWSVPTIRRTFASLLEQGLVLAERHPDYPYDATLYYTLSGVEQTLPFDQNDQMTDDQNDQMTDDQNDQINKEKEKEIQKESSNKIAGDFAAAGGASRLMQGFGDVGCLETDEEEPESRLEIHLRGLMKEFFGINTNGFTTAQRKKLREPVSITEDGKLVAYPSPDELYKTDPRFSEWIISIMRFKSGKQERISRTQVIKAARGYDWVRQGWIAWAKDHEEDETKGMTEWIIEPE